MATAPPVTRPVPPLHEAGMANVLIVDDRPKNLLALQAALAPLGQNVLEAGSGEEALRRLLKNDVAVIILDVQMPDLDGFETAAYMKQLDRTKHIPIIFLTAINKDAKHVFRGYTAGAVDYIFKPFDPIVLRSKVAVFIDLHNKKNELRTSEERFRRTFDHAPIGVALVSAGGSLLKVNKALEGITGMNQADLVSATVGDLLRDGEEPIDLDRLAPEVMHQNVAWQREYTLVTSGGEHRYVLASASAVPASEGQDPHYIFQITDITERRELETFRERFVSHAAHELRTPATVIAGTASLLHDSRESMSDAELDQCVTALHRQSQRLTTMVGNLLDLARLKEGRLDATLESLDLGAAVSAVVEANPAPSGTSIELHVPDGIRVLADAHGIDHVLSNLLVNAYRYGGRSIAIEAQVREGDVLLTVRDDGEGVPPDLLPRLFEPFTRGKKSSSVGGSGLGLALVQSLLEAGGGEVAYVGGADGAAFEIRLPGAP